MRGFEDYHLLNADLWIKQPTAVAALIGIAWLSRIAINAAFKSWVVVTFRRLPILK